MDHKFLQLIFPFGVIPVDSCLRFSLCLPIAFNSLFLCLLRFIILHYFLVVNKAESRVEDQGHEVGEQDLVLNGHH